MATTSVGPQLLREAQSAFRQGDYPQALDLLRDVAALLPDQPQRAYDLQVALGTVIVLALTLKGSGADWPAWLNDLLRALDAAARGGAPAPVDLLAELKAFLSEPPPAAPPAAPIAAPRPASERDRASIDFLTMQIRQMPRGMARQSMLMMRSEIFARLAEWPEAIADIREAIDNGGESPQIYLKLAAACESAGQRISAAAAAESALGMNPRPEDAATARELIARNS